MNYNIAGTCFFWYEIAGAFGGMTAGRISDRFFAGNRGPVNLLFMGVVFVMVCFGEIRFLKNERLR